MVMGGQITTSDFSRARSLVKSGYGFVDANINKETHDTTAKTIKGGIIGYVEVNKPAEEDVFVPHVTLSKNSGERIDDITFTTDKYKKKALENKGYEVYTEVNDKMKHQKFEYDSGLVFVKTSLRTYYTDESGFILVKPHQPGYGGGFFR